MAGSAYISAVIVGAGSGKRFKHSIPKQFVKLSGKPVIQHSLEIFSRVKEVSEVVAVVPNDYRRFWSNAERTRLPLKRILKVVIGGKTRQESVERGVLATNPKCKYVLIHDAARPLIRQDQIEELIAKVEKSKAAVLACPLVETLKAVHTGVITKTPPRQNYRLAQTPQAFVKKILLAALRKAEKDGFTGTDCSLLVERLGVKVAVVEGDRWNLKITEKADLDIAHSLLKTRKASKTKKGS